MLAYYVVSLFLRLLEVGGEGGGGEGGVLEGEGAD